MQGKIRIAVVGGKFGEIHIAGFQQCSDTEVIAVCGRNRDRAKELAMRYQIKGYYTNFDEMLKSDEIDVVSIAVPHNLHFSFAKRAFACGKHVICEKPLALDLGEAIRMAETAGESGLIHMVVFNLRFVPAVARMKELIDQGDVGPVRHIMFNWYTGGRKDRESVFGWRYVRSEAGFGALGDTGVHGIDLINWIFGEFKNVVSHMSIFVPEHRAENGGYSRTEVEDSCSFLAELKSGAQVIFHVSSVTSCESQLRLEAYGEKGVLAVHLLPREEYVGRLLGGRDERSLQKVNTIPDRLRLDSRVLNKKVPPRVLYFTHLAQELVKAVREEVTPSPNFLDGLKAQKVLQALFTSWNEKKWVSVE